MNVSSTKTDVAGNYHTTARPAPPLAGSKAALTTDQRKWLGITTASLMLGGTALSVAGPFGAGKAENDGTLKGDLQIPQGIDVAGNVTDDMKFESAFAAARHEVGAGGVFQWQGQWYNTFEEQEWNALSLPQRQEYAEKIAFEQLPEEERAAYQQAGPHADVQTVQPPIHYVEGTLDGQRVIGIDDDRDGVIDSIVMAGENENQIRCIDASGDEGLDTVLVYDTLHNEVVLFSKMEQPMVITEETFSENLDGHLSEEARQVLEADPGLPPAPMPLPQEAQHPAAAALEIPDDEPDDAVSSPDDDRWHLESGTVDEMDDDA